MGARNHFASADDANGWIDLVRCFNALLQSDSGKVFLNLLGNRCVQ